MLPNVVLSLGLTVVPAGVVRTVGADEVDTAAVLVRSVETSCDVVVPVLTMLGEVAGVVVVIVVSTI